MPRIGFPFSQDYQDPVPVGMHWAWIGWVMLRRIEMAHPGGLTPSSPSLTTSCQTSWVVPGLEVGSSSSIGFLPLSSSAFDRGAMGVRLQKLHGDALI